MERLRVDQILKPGAEILVNKIDFDDPKNGEIRQLFEDTRKQQEELIRIRDLPFENLLITI